ncbi:MAG: hypothetical protein HYV63_14925 [Candidatus Schekmanbacteria bacterium]|nr:hypothetical protein [Candidatus Schekmanbacteria bacterium]
MAATIDEISIAYEDDSGEKVKELSREVLSKGAWTTIMFLYQEMDTASGDFGPPKVSIRRYQKSGGVFRQRSKFNISSAKQAHAICDVLTRWYAGESESE